MDHERECAIRELLGDLGWLPSDLHCEEKKRLAEEYLNATTAWFEIGRGVWLTLMKQLRQNYNVSRPAEDEILAPAIEEARSKAVLARLALATHIKAHSC